MYLILHSNLKPVLCVELSPPFVTFFVSPRRRRRTLFPWLWQTHKTLFFLSFFCVCHCLSGLFFIMGITVVGLGFVHENIAPNEDLSASQCKHSRKDLCNLHLLVIECCLIMETSAIGTSLLDQSKKNVHNIWRMYRSTSCFLSWEKWLNVPVPSK